MSETTDANLAAFLLSRGYEFTYRTDRTGPHPRIYFQFPPLAPEMLKDLHVEFLNSDIQRFTDAQRTVKNLIRSVLV